MIDTLCIFQFRDAMRRNGIARNCMTVSRRDVTIFLTCRHHHAWEWLWSQPPASARVPWLWE